MSKWNDRQAYIEAYEEKLAICNLQPDVTPQQAVRIAHQAGRNAELAYRETLDIDDKGRVTGATLRRIA